MSCSFLGSVLSYNWDKSQFDLIPEVEIEQNRQNAQTTISSDNEALEDLFADDNLLIFFQTRNGQQNMRTKGRRKNQLRF